MLNYDDITLNYPNNYIYSQTHIAHHVFTHMNYPTGI